MRDKNNGEIAKSQMFGYALLGCGVPILMYFGGYETGYRGMSFIFCFLGFLLTFLTGIICKEDPDMFDAAAEMLHESTKRPFYQYCPAWNARRNASRQCRRLGYFVSG